MLVMTKARHQNKLHAEEVIRKMTVWTTVEKNIRVS